MKRALLVLVVCSVPAIMFLNAWQVFRFKEALAGVRELEQQQQELIEENKKTLVGIEVLSSPSRIDEIAGGIGEVEKRTDVPRVLIQIGTSGRGDQ